MPTDLTGLIERLEKATGPDREIDRDIGLAIDGWVYLPDDHEVALRFPEYPWLQAHNEIFADSDGALPPAAYTESIDDALALVERKLPGWQWEIGTWSYPEPGRRFSARVARPTDYPDHSLGIDAWHDSGETPAIALCLALLRCLESQK